ncbi:MAG: T9SS type A sorting domain-containing protein [Saprospiraceae bacterium]|nr:T9SS type A sorting domain-containing protein [Saprospiraceae bacterium]
MDLYDSLGAKIRRLGQGISRVGLHIFESSDVFPAGVYYITITTSNEVISKKMLIQ